MPRHLAPERTLAGAGQDLAYGLLRALRLRTLGRASACNLVLPDPFDFLTGVAMLLSSRRRSDFKRARWCSRKSLAKSGCSGPKRADYAFVTHFAVFCVTRFGDAGHDLS
jgi:hypothetical protein